MRINIRAKDFEVTDSIKSYIEEKSSKLNKYISKEDMELNVLLSGNKNINYSVEFTLNTGNLYIRAEEKNADLYAGIDLSIDKIERQIRKNKTKLSKRREEIFIYEEIEELKSNEKSIVKRKKIELIPMNEEEAILQMELLGHDFFIFKDAESMDIKVLYKRKDENYGLIQEDK
jgi:ribosomal subunit interface protein